MIKLYLLELIPISVVLYSISNIEHWPIGLLGMAISWSYVLYYC
jgi:hypothetical protein